LELLGWEGDLSATLSERPNQDRAGDSQGRTWKGITALNPTKEASLLSTQLDTAKDSLAPPDSGQLVQETQLNHQYGGRSSLRWFELDGDERSLASIASTFETCWTNPLTRYIKRRTSGGRCIRHLRHQRFKRFRKALLKQKRAGLPFRLQWTLLATPASIWNQSPR